MKKWNLIVVWTLPSVVMLLIAGLFGADIMRVFALGGGERGGYFHEQADLIDLIESRYVEKVDERALFEGAMKGMVRAVGDKYSAYLTEEGYQRLMEGTSGKYVGIGVIIDLGDQNRLTILSTIEGSPAFTAGLLPGDSIAAIGDTPVDDLSIEDAVGLMKGKKGEPVALTVVRRGSASQTRVTVVRDTIDVPSVRGTAIADEAAHVGYIRISTFDDDTDAEVRLAMEKLLKEGARSVVLDLRDNGGGDFETCRKVAGLFIPRGTIVSTVGRDGRPAAVYAAEGKATADEKFPIAILINEWSASASEIVAAAMQDLKRATLVGTPTFGKGSVQEVIPLGKEHKTALKMTTAHWLRPSGAEISPRSPVMPDLTVKIGESDWTELMRKRALGEAWRRPEGMERDPVDAQLIAAMELLRKKTE